MKPISETDNTKAVDSSRPASDENKPHDNTCGSDDGPPEGTEPIGIPAHAPLYGGKPKAPEQEDPQAEKDATPE